MSSLSHRPYQRVTVYRVMRDIIDRYERDDYPLARQVELAQADGYGTGGDGGGRSKGDHSDPTGAAVVGNDDEGPDRRKDPATVAFDALEAAAIALNKADNARRFALPPRPDEEPPAAAVDLKAERDEWCVSCARVKHGTEQLIFEEVAARGGGRRDLCAWCQEYWLASGKAGKRRLPDPRLIMLRQYTRRLGLHATEGRMREALRLTSAEARSRYLGVHASNEQSAS